MHAVVCEWQHAHVRQSQAEVLRTLVMRSRTLCKSGSSLRALIECEGLRALKHVDLSYLWIQAHRKAKTFDCAAVSSKYQPHQDREEYGSTFIAKRDPPTQTPLFAALKQLIPAISTMKQRSSIGPLLWAKLQRGIHGLRLFHGKVNWTHV